MGLLDRAVQLKSSMQRRIGKGLRARASQFRGNTTSSGAGGRGLLSRAALFHNEKKKDPVASLDVSSSELGDIETVRDALDRKVLDLTNLFEISKEINGTLNQENLLSTLLFSAMGQMGVQKIAVCSRVEGSGYLLSGQKGLDGVDSALIRFPLLGGLAGCFISSDRPVETAALLGSLNGEERAALDAAGTELVVPLVNKEDLVGFLLLGGRYGQIPYGEDDREFLATLASMAAISMENARLYSRLEQKLNQLAALYEISRIINSSTVRDQVLDLVGETLATGFGLLGGALYLLDEDGFHLSRMYGIAQDEEVLVRLPADHSEFSAVLTLGEAADFPDFSSRESLSGLFPERIYAEFQSMLLVPLLAAGRQVGILAIFSLEAHAKGEFRKEERELFSIIASQVAPPVLMAGMVEQAKHEVKDPFSPFLELVKKEYARAKEFALSLGILCVKITGLEKLAAEDDQVPEFVDSVGVLIRSLVDEKYTVIRSGASEFSCMLPGLPVEEQEVIRDGIRADISPLLEEKRGVLGVAFTLAQLPEEYKDPASFIFQRGS